ncbi:MAG: hypothetical protein IH599_09235 [Bacteroidales bacterium]|nr:hypothetical protein [Bacteroidales bacterium]
MRNAILVIFVLILGIHTAGAQERDFELLKTRLDLLDARLQLLDRALYDMEARPAEFSNQMDAMDRYFQLQRDSIMLLLNRAGYLVRSTDSFRVVEVKQNIYMDPYRLFEGSILVGYERAVNPGLSLELAFLGTYLTKGGGLGGGYFRSQDLAAYNEMTSSYESIDGDMITGWGLQLKAKKYLLNRINPTRKAPLGLYAAPQLLYRNLAISGWFYDWVYDNGYSNYVPMQEVTRHLHVFAGGLILGGKFTLMKVFSVDAYIGGMMRLSRYTNEHEFTKYKEWNNIDYSGVLPTAGISLGILQ